MTLLQTADSLRSPDTDPRLVTYFVLAVLGITALVLIGTLIGRRAARTRAAGNREYNSGQFHRAGKALGLEARHIDMLEGLVRACRVRRPFLLFTSAGLLDDTLKKGLSSMEYSKDLSDEERESRKSIIFEIKQIIERNARRDAALHSTTFLRPGQALTITPEGGGPFASKVVSNMKDFLTVAAPALPAGIDTRWMRGTRLAVYLWRDSEAGYAFPSKVLGYDTVRGIPSVLIQHSKTLRRAQRRTDRRRDLNRPCFSYPIRIEELGQGRKAQRRAVVEQNLRALGTIVDLSAGGCAIQTANPLEKGKLVMVEFDLQRRSSVRAFGKVMQSRRTRGTSGLMHVMFTRVTQQHLNRISEFVYQFTALPAGARMQAEAVRTKRAFSRPEPR